MSYLSQKRRTIGEMINNVVGGVDLITRLLPEGIRDKVKDYTGRISTNSNLDPTMSSLIRSWVQSFNGKGNLGGYIGNVNQSAARLLQIFSPKTIDNYNVIKES
jgi:hypothetical protein